MYYIEYDRFKYLLYAILCFALIVVCSILLINYDESIGRKIYASFLIVVLFIGLIFFLYYFMTPKPFMVISSQEVSIKHPGFPNITLHHSDILSIYSKVEYAREFHNRFKKKKKQLLYIQVSNDLIVQKQIPFHQRDRFRKESLSGERTFKFPVEDVNHKMEDILYLLRIHLKDKVKIS